MRRCSTCYNTPSTLREQEEWLGKAIGVAVMGVFAWGMVKLGLALVNLAGALQHVQALPKGF